MTTTTTHTFEKSIRYDRETRDFRATLDGNYIGHFGSYYEAELALDEVAYNLVMDGQCATAAELDGGASVEEIAADYACSEAHPCDRPNHNHSRNYCSAAAAPLPVDALLDEADAALAHCPGAFGPCGADAHPSYAPYCQRCALALQRVAVAAYVQRLAEDIGLMCAFCGEAHAAADCALRRPLVVPGPRVCQNCGGAHSIQQCDELRAALFAAEVFEAVAA